MARGKNSIVIKAEHVNKEYVGETVTSVAIKDVSINVKRGEFVSILGPSGSGKTTLLDMIGTLDTPTGGRIFIDGLDTSKLNGDELSILRNRKIGFIFQSYNLVPYLSVIQNATLPLMVEGGGTPENIGAARSMLIEMGLEAHMDKKPAQLSGGQQQRVAIVRALVNNPPILLADEPTGNLDSKSADVVLKMLIKMSKEKNTTILMVTHDPQVASLSERSIYLRDGLVERETKVRK